MRRTASSTWLIGIGALIAVLIIVSVVIGLTGGSAGADLQPAGTAVGTVQRYLLALERDEPAEAYEFLAANVKDECPYQRFLTGSANRRGNEFTAVLARSDAVNGTEVVTLEITEFFYNPPFTTNQHTMTQTFTLTEQDGGWLLSEPAWPVGFCPPVRGSPDTPVERPPEAAVR